MLCKVARLPYDLYKCRCDSLGAGNVLYGLFWKVGGGGWWWWRWWRCRSGLLVALETVGWESVMGIVEVVMLACRDRICVDL